MPSTLASALGVTSSGEVMPAAASLPAAVRLSSGHHPAAQKCAKVVASTDQNLGGLDVDAHERPRLVDNAGQYDGALAGAGRPQPATDVFDVTCEASAPDVDRADVEAPQLGGERFEGERH